MSKTQYPNRDALRKAHDIYLDAIYPFVSKFLDKFQNTTVIEEKIEISNVAHLVRTYWSDYFRDQFEAIDPHYEARSAIGLIVEGRNRASHPPWDLDIEFTRTQLFLIAEVLGKINRSDAQREIEAIRAKLFDDTAEQLVTAAVEAGKAKYEKSIVEVRKRLETAQENNKKLSGQIIDNAVKLDEKKEELEKLSGHLVNVRSSKKKYEEQFNSTSKQLEKVQAVHSTCEERLTTISNQLVSTEAERDDYKERLETASKELEEAEAGWQACEDGLVAMQNLFTASTIGNMVFPPFETDSTVRILDRRGMDKGNFLLDLLEEKQPAIIYVQSEDKIKQLSKLVGPEKADVIGEHNERTSEEEETEILEKLENGELIAVVSDTTLSTLARSHCVEHFVFCHLVPSLDVFFKQCEPAFTLEKNTYLHLIYNGEEDIKGLDQWLTQKYPDAEALGGLYRELRRLVETDGDLIKSENVYNENIYNKLGIAKLGVETGLAIFEELQFLERNEIGVKVLPDPEKRGLDESEIHCGGEKLKLEIAEIQAFQLKQQIEQIWEEIKEKLDVDSEQILREVNTDEVYANVSKAENGQQPAEAVENDNTVDGEDVEVKQAPKPARANAKITKEQVKEIRSRSAAGESNSELAEEDSEKKPEVKQSEFWQPIRDGEFGALFAGRPVPVSNEGWITKTIRNIGVCLYLTNQRCYVQIYFHGANGSERREKIMTLFPKSEYAYVYRDSPRETKVQFPVLDKGKNDREAWNEIREKLVNIGTDIYNKIDESALQVKEIRARSAAGESNSELAEEDSEKKPEVKQSEFWQPIRDGEFGALFAGKPVRVRDDGWISKQIRGVEIILSFRKNHSYVSFLCTGENRIERRDEIIALFPETDYDYSPRESPQRAGFEFPVINKGKDHPEDWDEIRKKLVAMGTDIYNKIDESDL